MDMGKAWECQRGLDGTKTLSRAKQAKEAGEARGAGKARGETGDEGGSYRRSRRMLVV